MSEFKLTRKIPPPTKPSTRLKYPWHDMEPGDSFFVPEDGRGARKIQSALNAGACRYFIHRTQVVTENGVRGVRVWRIE